MTDNVLQVINAHIRVGGCLNRAEAVAEAIDPLLHPQDCDDDADFVRPLARPLGYHLRRAPGCMT